MEPKLASKKPLFFYIFKLLQGKTAIKCGYYCIYQSNFLISTLFLAVLLEDFENQYNKKISKQFHKGVQLSESPFCQKSDLVELDS